MSIWQPFSDEGDSIRLVSCRLCGAAVKTSTVTHDKERHEKFHVLLNEVFMVVNVVIPTVDDGWES